MHACRSTNTAVWNGWTQNLDPDLLFQRKWRPKKHEMLLLPPLLLFLQEKIYVFQPHITTMGGQKGFRSFNLQLWVEYYAFMRLLLLLVFFFLLAWSQDFLIWWINKTKISIIEALEDPSSSTTCNSWILQSRFGDLARCESSWRRDCREWEFHNINPVISRNVREGLIKPLFDSLKQTQDVTVGNLIHDENGSCTFSLE